MAALMGRTELGVRKFGSTATVPFDPKAKLMYYLDCMCAVLDLSDQSNLTRLRNYRRYFSLTEQETDALLALCFLLSPNELLGKVIFQNNTMCGEKQNAFFEISAVRRNLLVSESIIIGGQQRHVSKIMAFKQEWVTEYWIESMQHFTPRLARIAAGGSDAATPQPRRAIQYQVPVDTYTRTNTGSTGCCTIL